jgi:ABC-type uncharacterized transport system permease subunit
MSLIASLGAIEIGLIFGLVALGVFLSFRIINFPDLTVDGSFPLGGAVAAALIVAGWNPFAATAVAIVAGALAGYLTAWLNVHLRIMQLLASILVMIGLYSVNLRIMGKPNVALIDEPTLFSLVTFGGLPDYWAKPLVLLVIVIGLAAVIIGETILPARSLVVTTLACILGAVLYRFFIALALNSDFIGLKAQDLNLVTAVLVAFALLVPTYKRKLAGLWPGARSNAAVAVKEAK